MVPPMRHGLGHVSPLRTQYSTEYPVVKALPLAIPTGCRVEHARGSQGCRTACPAAAWLGAVLWAGPQRDVGARAHAHRRVCGGLAPRAKAAILLPPDPDDAAPGLPDPRTPARRARPEARADVSSHAIHGQEGGTPCTPMTLASADHLLGRTGSAAPARV